MEIGQQVNLQRLLRRVSRIGRRRSNAAPRAEWGEAMQPPSRTRGAAGGDAGELGRKGRVSPFHNNPRRGQRGQALCAPRSRRGRAHPVTRAAMGRERIRRRRVSAGAGPWQSRSPFPRVPRADKAIAEVRWGAQVTPWLKSRAQRCASLRQRCTAIASVYRLHDSCWNAASVLSCAQVSCYRTRTSHGQ